LFFSIEELNCSWAAIQDLWKAATWLNDEFDVRLWTKNGRAEDDALTAAW
jgi:hypothetical protein